MFERILIVSWNIYWIRAHIISHKLQKDIKMVYGQLW